MACTKGLMTAAVVGTLLTYHALLLNRAACTTDCRECLT